MKTEGERYAYLQKESGLSKTGFATSLGLSRSHGYHIEKDDIKLSHEVLERLVSLYHVNLNWYIFGQGSPFVFNEALIRLIKQEVAAGRGMEIQDYAEEKTLKLPRSLISPYRPENLIAVYVKGDSMIGEQIHDGDAVVYHPGLTEGNGIYVLSLDTALLVKRVSFDDMPRSISLISANPAYPTRQITGPELGNLRIEGRVVTCVHKF
jgi:transcriptional regulator with XRE-family HTH domain